MSVGVCARSDPWSPGLAPSEDMSSKTVTLRPKRRVSCRSVNKKGGDGDALFSPRNGANGKASPAGEASPQLLFSSNPHPMYVIDRKSQRFLEVNSAAIKKYGYSREEFLKMRVADIHAPEDASHVLEAVRWTGESLAFHGHWRHCSKSGELFDVEVTTQGIPFAGRKALLTVAQDISARRAAEDKVAEHAAYLHALAENNPLAIVVLDADRRIQMCNPAFEVLFGFHMAEILGAELDRLLAPDEFLQEAIALNKRAEAGEVVRADSKRRRSDGSLVDVRIIGVPLVVNGKRIGSFCMYEDISERRRAEEARRRAEERLQSLFENSVEGIFRSTPEGSFVSLNPALAAMCGYDSPEDMISSVHQIGRDIYADPQCHEEFRRLIGERGAVEAFECQMRRKDGSTLWVSENVRAVRTSDGTIAGYEGTIMDISDRKRSDLERLVTTEIIQSVSATHNLDELLVRIHSALKKVLYAENCFVALCEPSSGTFHFPFFVDKYDEVPQPQKVGRSCTAYVYRTNRAMLIPQKEFDRLVGLGEVELVGTPSPSWLGVPLRTPAATIGVLVVQHYEDDNAYTQRDLEFLSSVGGQIAFAIERKRAEEKLRESEARLRLLVEQLPAVLWTVDRSLRFTSAVGAGLSRLGLRPDETVGMSLLDYFETTDSDFEPIAAHKRAVAGEPAMFHLEWKEGSYACHAEPLRGADGKVSGAICMCLDITDRKQLEEQLRHAQKMEAVGRLAGGIAHDFNNLLMVIQGYGDLLTERLAKNDPLQRNAVQIQMAAQRASSLTRQLLAFSRKQMLAPTVLNIHTVVADMEKILRRLIGEDVRLETSSVPDLWLVKADRSQLEQVVMNLAVNARDAMPIGGRLAIETVNATVDASFSHTHAVIKPGDYVVLSVTDSGCGMDSETQAHLFEPFFTTKEKGKGTGLGLATVYGIVKQSGGYIWVYSELNRGSTFKIYLPRIGDEGMETGQEKRAEACFMQNNSETILLVEDEDGVRELAREYLEMGGYKVIEAEDGHTALELAAMHGGPIHLLLTDIVMPGISGREVAERIRALRPDIKVLYMSGYTDQVVVHQGILDEDAMFLQKPFTMTTLSSKLRELLAEETVH